MERLHFVKFDRFQKLQMNEWHDPKHRRLMQIALNISRNGLGLVAPNPSVGCIIEDSGVILSRGCTQPSGRPHAEFIAIRNNIYPITNSTTLYVTLEPCGHISDKPSCANVIIESGIKNVFIAAMDPDDRTSGNSIKRLKQAGISVCTGLMEEDAKKINRGFFYSKILNRPFITVKAAITLDGKVASFSGQSKWITTENTRYWCHKLRCENDAIILGTNTFLRDNPVLSCRLPGLEKYQIMKFVLDNHMLINSDRSDVVFITGEDTQKQNYVQVTRAKDGHLDLQSVMMLLAKRGVTRLLVEGVNSLFCTLLKNDLIDKLVLCRSNSIGGKDAIPLVGNLEIDNVNFFPRFTKEKSFQMDSDTIEIFEKHQTNLV